MNLMEQLLPGVGEVIAGRYELSSELGRGGFGIVYRATQLKLRQDVAVKVLLPHVVENDEIARRFEREVDIAKGLRHPNTIRILDFDRTDRGLPFFVMEFVEGRSLADVLAADGPLSPARARGMLIQLLKSLGEAHERGVVHRDLKPANLLVTEVYGEPDFIKVLDFGIAKAFGGDSQTTQTQTGHVMGTPSYMAPEQALGLKTVDGRADLYAAGLILAECLTGRRVVEGETPYAVVAQHVSPAPLTFPPGLHQSPLWPVIATATAKRPEERYPSSAAMRAALEVLGALPEHPDPRLFSVAEGPQPQPSYQFLSSGPPTPTPHALGDTHSADTLVGRTATRRRKRSRNLTLALVATAALASGIFALLPVLRGGPERPVVESPGPEATAHAPAAPATSPEAPPAAPAAPAPPAVGPPPTTSSASPEVMSAIAVSRERIGAAIPAAHAIRIDGEAITVSVGGREIGQTPLDLHVPRLEAELALELRREGYEPETRRLSLLEDHIEVDLRRAGRSRDSRATRPEGTPGRERANPEPTAPTNETPADTPPTEDAAPAPFGRATVYTP